MRPSKLCSRELHGALADEQRRQAVDAAKKKAVAQHADYDTFKKMVSVAHLKPLQAPSSHAGHKSLLPAWQLDPASLSRQQQHASQHHISSTSTSTSSNADTAPMGAQLLPSNSQEFVREWRRRCPTAADKYGLLKQCGAHGLSAIFRVEIDGQLLGQVLHALQQALAEAASTAAAAAGPEQGMQQQQQQQASESASLRQVVVREAVTMVQLLHSLTGTGRFGLSVALLDAGARQAGAQLCAALGQALQDQDQEGQAAEAGHAAAAAAAATVQEAWAQLQHVQSKLRV